MKSPLKYGWFGKIKTFIAFWIIVIVLSAVAIAILLFFTGKKFQSYSKEMLYFTQIDQITHQLESAILSERRNDLLWQTTKDQRFLQYKKRDLNDAGEFFDQLLFMVKNSNEKRLFSEIEKSYHLFITAATTNSAQLPELDKSADNLLINAERFRNNNQKSLEELITRFQHLNRLEDEYLLGLIVIGMTIVTVGAISLYRRIVQPTIELSRTVTKFGHGDFNVRAVVKKNDEMGNLYHTFNNMADDIVHRDKARTEFIASIVHDIKNPLVFIGGTVRMLKNGKIEKSKQDFWLDRIIKNVKSLENLAADLMDSLQVQTGHLTLQLQPLNFTRFLRDIHTEQNNIIKSHTICFEADGDCYILGDDKRLERVVVNFISNAIKYSPEKSTINLKLQRKEADVCLTIQDHGIGIPETDIPVIFQPFGRLNDSKDKIRGAGLGLYTVKKIIESHGGSISVESELGVGTIFEVKFPRA